MTWWRRLRTWTAERRRRRQRRDLRTRLLWAGVRIGGAAAYELAPL